MKCFTKVAPLETDHLTFTATAMNAETAPNSGPSLADSADQRGGVLRFESIPALSLDVATKSAWDAVRGALPWATTSFFSHDFICAVAELLPHIEVGVAFRGDEPIAFLPFQRCGTVAKPVGLGINDAHGLLLKPGEELRLTTLLDALGVTSYPFHAAPVSSQDVAEFEVGRTRAFLADLTVDPLGYEHYLKSRNKTIGKQPQKTRRLARDLGPIRFEFDCRDSRMLERLVELKRQQYQRTYTFDILSVEWIRDLLSKLHRKSSGAMRGILNVLYAGDQPVALHYGMVEGQMLHYWFPVFDPDYAYCSPGTELFLQVAREATEQGFTAIDMGYGEQAYKHKLTNVVSEMSYGLVDKSARRRAMFRVSNSMRSKMKRLMLREKLKPFARRLMPDIGKGQYVG